MKRILFVMLALVLVICACTPAPAKPPTATEAPVAAQPTDTEAPVVLPSDTPAPVDTDTPAPADTQAAASSAPAQNSFGDITFTNRATGATISGTGNFSVNAFAYSCSNVPADVVLNVSTSNADIYKINYVYRLTAIDAPTISSGWSGDAKMTSAGAGSFSVDFQSTVIKSDWRIRKAWLDLQFIAFDNADVTYVSPAFTRLITYNQCP